MQHEIKQGTTGKLYVYLVDSTDHVTPETGVTSPTLTISKNGGAFGAISDGTWAELAGGVYTVQVNGTDSNTLGDLVVRVVKAGCDDYRAMAPVVANLEADTIAAIANISIPSAATIAAAVQVLLDAAHGEDSWEALDIDTAKAAIAEAVRVLLEFYHGPGSWEGGAGALPDVGEVAVTYTVYDTNKTTPLSGVVVRVSTDALGVNTIRGKISDVFGQVRFNLDRGTYYIWRYRGDKEFSNPDIEVVE